ncbi:hypothetical protein [Brevibacillus halotolerans]|uniref:hypothetical protein n=1 Tax=Brevibacillus halotolerans TaxID=1507437 RepID=UPI0015EEF0E2|nr:hypothetical protein [Brevibacillus halotolerans]MBA4532400.1 hypothetical protein [Brevibacillus halotolerans]
MDVRIYHWQIVKTCVSRGATMGYLSFVDQYGIYTTISYHLTFMVIHRLARCHGALLVVGLDKSSIEI